MKAKHYILIAIILSLAFILVGYMNYLSKDKVLKQNISDDIRREQKYEQCKDVAYAVYVADWNGGCELLGKEKYCALPGYRADNFNNKRSIDEANCIKLYSK
jgi:hypothetical protein